MRSLACELGTRRVDRLIVSEPVNLRYLSSYTGTNGLLLICAHEHVPHRFFTDFRYVSQAAQQVPAPIEREIVAGDLLEAAARLLDEERGEDESRLGFDDAALTVKQHARLRELLDDSWELVPCAGLIERLREVKDEHEVAAIRAATELADEALTGLLEGGLVGRSERDVAIDLELRMRRLGAQASSFPSIVASGEHGALPHAEPREEPIAPNVLVTIDWGARLDGYCSDCTRTYATGAVEEQAREVYELVLSAQEAALRAVRAGISGREVDAVARTIIDEAGHAEHFGHGLGHGVGLDIHEAPRLSRTASEDPLRAGNIVTVEPGVYVPERFGVRIEDLALVGEQGSERLTSLPKELLTVD
ncbi:MAG: Xaa-Pro peptidase family protein [Solirubrobacteraceae bacterium]